MLHSPIMASATPTLAAAREALLRGDFDDRWKETTRKKIRGSAKTALQVYKVIAGVHSAHLILCDVRQLDELCAPYLKEKRVPEGCGFKSFESFYTWWSNMRRLFDVSSGARARSDALRAQADDWSELTAHLSGHRGAPDVLDKKQMIPILVLTQICRAQGVQPRDVSASVVMRLASEIQSAQRTAVKGACRVLDGLRGRNEVPADLLPAAPIGDLPALTPPNRRQTPPLSADYTTLMEDFVEMKRKGRRWMRFGTTQREVPTEGVGDCRLKNIGMACRWYWHGLVELGIADPKAPIDPARLAQPEILVDVATACAEGKLGGSVDPVTRRAWARDVIHFLDFVAPGYAVQIDPNFFRAEYLKPGPKEERIDNEQKRRTCLRYINSEDLQRRFFLMPKTFYDEARDLIDRFDELKPEGRSGLSRHQHRALDLAIMAPHAALATRYPLRLDTRSKLKFRGPENERHIFFPEDGGQSDCVILNIPGEIMKNGAFADGVPLEPSKHVDPREIFEWYLTKAHPLVLKHKPTVGDLRDPTRLFCGLHNNTLRRIWQRYTAEAGCYLNPHMCRHVLASLLYADGVPIEQIAELLGHKSVDTTRENYAFVETAKMIQSAMDAQARKFKKLGV